MVLVGVVGMVVWRLWTGESWVESFQFGGVLALCWAVQLAVVRVVQRRAGR
ncbi:hypothetical protein [Streptomyces californicus]|uniref:hypothetical protein n=1 Tax=Streptomyces californicus TaxID=67351 RepID=UPI0036CE7CAA